MEIVDIQYTRSLAESAAKQIEAAIRALVAGDIEVAITLAGAAEGMIHGDDVGLPRMIAQLQRKDAQFDRTVWIAKVNRERDWLKHGGAETMSFDRLTP